MGPPAPRDRLLARYGGEEFAVVLPDCDLHGAVAVSTSSAEPPRGEQTVSIGIARGTDRRASRR